MAGKTPETTPEPTNKPNPAHRKRIADLVLLDGNGNHLLLAVDQGKDGDLAHRLLIIHPETGDRYRVSIKVEPVRALESMRLPAIVVRQGLVPTKP